MKHFVFIVIQFALISFYYCESSTIRNKRDLKPDLLTKAGFLSSRAKNEITSLVQQNRTEDAKLIEVYENRINDLLDELKDISNETIIKQLDQLLAHTEAVLILAFERIGVKVFDYKELKNALIIYGEEILLKANQQIINLKNNTNDAQIIEKDIKLINASLINLRNATVLYEIFDSELNLNISVARIQQDLAHFNISLNIGNNRYFLLIRAQYLAQQMAAGIKIFKTKFINESFDEDLKNNIVIINLESGIKNIALLVKQLLDSTDNATVNAFALNITLIDARYESQLTMLGIYAIRREDIISLLRKIDDLSAHTSQVSRDLLKLNKTLEFDEFRHQNNLLLYLSVAIRNVVNPLDLVYFEYRYREMDVRVKYLAEIYGVY